MKACRIVHIGKERFEYSAFFFFLHICCRLGIKDPKDAYASVWLDKFDVLSVLNNQTDMIDSLKRTHL